MVPLSRAARLWRKKKVAQMMTFAPTTPPTRLLTVAPELSDSVCAKAIPFIEPQGCGDDQFAVQRKSLE